MRMPGIEGRMNLYPKQLINPGIVKSLKRDRPPKNWLETWIGLFSVMGPYQNWVSIEVKYDLMDLHTPYCYLPKGEVGSFSVKQTLDSSR